jgi:starch phosphorylase
MVARTAGQRGMIADLPTPLDIPTDLAQRVDELESRLLPALRPLARVAYNYAWSWGRGGTAVFAALDPHRWRLSRENPVRFLGELSRSAQEAAARNGELLQRIDRLAGETAADAAQPLDPRAGLDGPVAFLCAEFGVHESLPVYSGGLGVLAGDFLKEASDRGLPLLGIGLFYRRGYFAQRLDLSGWQQEYWLEHDPAHLPLALVQGRDGEPLRLSVSLFGRTLGYQIWCAEVGRVPLLLLDADLAENDALQRWTTGRLYEGSAPVRLAQYGLLGIGGARTLEALGIEPAVLHLNEGHPALAPLELAAQRVERGAAAEEALADLRRRVVFTTHTPLPAGNETYSREQFLEAFGELAPRLGVGEERFLDLCAAAHGEVGLSQLAMRLAGRRNAVSRAHRETAQAMWHEPFPDLQIDHVTNGAHLASWLCEPVARLFDAHLDGRWRRNPADPAAWEGVRGIPNEELWAARREARTRLVEYARAKSRQDRLLRGESLDFIAAEALDPDALTLGFARRLVAYKRLHLLFGDAERFGNILGGVRAVQLVLAGKAHPRDDEGRSVLQPIFHLRRQPGTASARAVFLEDYDLSVARELVAGCDVWINLPRPPLEASGTSGMKATFNGVLQLSVLDGWWAEAFDGRNGWAIASDAGADRVHMDAADGDRLYTLLEREVIPLFHDRDAAGVPHGWCELVKEALASCAGAFTATRMLEDYVDRIYVPLRSGG